MLSTGIIQYPIEGPYQNSTIKSFNQLNPPQEQSAVDVKDDTNNEPDCVGRTVPVVMKWAGQNMSYKDMSYCVHSLIIKYISY